jgi:hypothetical protein
MMTDEQFTAAFATLAPTTPQRQRMESTVSAWLEARDTSLVAEWLALLRLSPAAGFGLGAVSAASLALSPPFVWLARALV